MVNPLYIIAAYLAAAFAIPVFDKAHRKLSLGIFFLVMIYALVSSCQRLLQISNFSALESQVFTAGFAAPWSIALSFGIKEAFLLILFNLAGLLSGIYLFKRLNKDVVQAQLLLLLVLLGATGLVLTRDIFNSFVFLEILSISTFAFIGIKSTGNTLAAGFKYMMAGGIASSFLLIGIIFAYRYTGTLNLDAWISSTILMTPGYRIALYLIIMSVIIELKPFPANGWALDVYETSHAGVGALISTVNTGAMLYFFYKLLPLLPQDMLYLISGAGLVSFFFSNLVGLRQKSSTRLLGYSSTAQTGLIIFVLAGLSYYSVPHNIILLIAAGLFLTNFFAKTGLFWLSGLLHNKQISSWSGLKAKGSLVVGFAIFVFALAGFPPFPAFYAKWELMKALSSNSQWLLMGVILMGSLFEIVYLLRWFGLAVKGEDNAELKEIGFSKYFPVFISFCALMVSALFAFFLYHIKIEMILPVVGLMIFGAIDFYPAKLKGLVAIGILAAWGWYFIWPQQWGIVGLFGLMLVGAAVIQLFNFLRYKDIQWGLFPLLTMLILSMGNLLIAENNLQFFLSWELMTIATYLLILRGKQSRVPALSYISFSMGGAYLILAGLMLVPGLISSYAINAESHFTNISLIGLILLGIGFLIKVGALGVHVWLPGAYTEAEEEFTGIMSSVISKAGVFGLVIILIYGHKYINQTILYTALGWLGALTAFFGALMAVFQEDVKKLLAYSSMSQVGYIVLSLAMMTHLGWVSGLYMAVNHLLFKALIFTAISAVILKTGTRNMYEMGGLIKKMPIAYISVLMGIIAASGVPPLTGFGAKWFIYSALIERGWYLQAGLAFFASAVAFLYLYKLIHTVFLGQAKPNQSKVKEAPIWMIIPQGIFIMLIMGFSMFPNYLTKPLSHLVGMYIPIPNWLNWQGYNIALNSPMLHGNWNGNLVMMVTMGVFGFPLIWLLLVNAKTQKVKQFNIVFAAERPYKPWTTHFAHNMFAHYNKALGFLVKPKITAFWQNTAEWTHSISATLARIYTGNGQTYLLHIFMYVLIIYLIGGIR